MIVRIDITFEHEDGSTHQASVNEDGWQQWGADTATCGESVDLIDAIRDAFYEQLS